MLTERQRGAEAEKRRNGKKIRKGERWINRTGLHILTSIIFTTQTHNWKLQRASSTEKLHWTLCQTLLNLISERKISPLYAFALIACTDYTLSCHTSSIYRLGILRHNSLQQLLRWISISKLRDCSNPGELNLYKTLLWFYSSCRCLTRCRFQYLVCKPCKGCWGLIADKILKKSLKCFFIQSFKLLSSCQSFLKEI